MMLQYVLEAGKYNELVESKVVEGVEKVSMEKCSTIEVNVDFTYNTVSVWENAWGSSTLLNDYVTVNDIEKLESESFSKVVDDIYVSNIEIAEYLEVFDIPHEWAIEAVDEWRSPEKEEMELENEDFWEAIDGIKQTWELSREEKLTR